MKKQPTGVKLVNITKIYPDHKDKSKSFKAVDNVSLEINPGDFITLLGPSGCGKTTTLRMIAGFEDPNGGDLYIGGQMVNEIPPNKRDTAMVFQSYALFPQYNIFDNIAYGLKIQKVPKAEVNKRVHEMLELVELTGMENRMTNQLSGGQQQRVALARALVMEPAVLLFDEPLSNLDAKLRVAMRTEIRRIQQKVGITAIYVTHDQSEAMSISDKIIIMNKGIIEQMGTPQEIYYHPVNEFVADFIGEANFLEGTVLRAEGDSCEIDISGAIIQVSGSGKAVKGKSCKIVLRPEAASIRDKGLLPCHVVMSTFMGSYQDYHVMVQNNLVKIIDSNPINRKVYEAGEKAFLDFAPENVHIL
ncbi:ABC transporter ATP-binding protein [Oscillospiraceae bacterium MB08-C2-2]|nr:ABC transporter ATP-binding protein [Oscillospiraceae bacterium MB08-C2-2]